jgi:hypothetical protein
MRSIFVAIILGLLVATASSADGLQRWQLEQSFSDSLVTTDTPISGDVDFGGYTGVNLSTPTTPGEIATKGYVDGIGVPSHATSHENGGGDEISVTGLSGLLADNQNPTTHALGGSAHSADTLANLNTKISDATLDDSGDPRTPTSHASSHEVGGSDLVDHDSLTGFVASEHIDWTADQGATNINDANIEIGVDHLTDVDTTTTPPSVGNVLRWDGSNWVPVVPIDISTLTQTTNTSTTSTSYVVISGMTTTPASGTYYVSFSSSGDSSTGGDDYYYAIFVGGSIVQHSQREASQPGFGNGTMVWFTQATVTVNGAQAVEIRYYTNTGATLTCHERSLLVFRIGE